LAFQGVRNNAENFKVRVLQEHAGNSAALVSLADLQEKAKTIFGPSPMLEPRVVLPSFDALLSHESNPILSKRVLGREDVDIAAMIKALGNSDWVRQGRAYFDEATGVCPFCQQATEASFAASLEAYFDETFLDDSRAIDELAKTYAAAADHLLAQLSEILNAPSRFLDAETLKTEVALLASRMPSIVSILPISNASQASSLHWNLWLTLWARSPRHWRLPTSRSSHTTLR